MRETKGFSLVELMVATAVMLILLVPLMSFMRAGQMARSSSLRLTGIEQNARAALQSIGRDIQNAGYNLAPNIPINNCTMFATLTGPALPAPSPAYFFSPVIPGDNLNLVRTQNSAGATVSNQTDQITLISVDQLFNNGLPLSGNVTNSSGSPTFQLSGAPPPDFADLVVGDFVVVSLGGNVALVRVMAKGASTLTFGSDPPLNLNQPSSGPIATIASTPQGTGQVSVYKANIITYYVDGDGNLIRREKLPPPHTAYGGYDGRTPTAITPDPGTFSCGENGLSTCYYDSIIATGIENLQFTYYLFLPNSSVTISGPVADPGYYGRTTNGSSSFPYRMLDIRQVNVSITVRAHERDRRIRDPYNGNNGYLYRFSLNTTFNTRNFYGSDFRPN